MLTDPIRKKDQLKKLADYWLEQGNYRNYVFIVLGAFTALRVGDLLRLRWDDVYNKNTNRCYSHFTVKEEKTGKKRTIALNRQAAKALLLYYPHRHSEYLFGGIRSGDFAIGRNQAWRIMKHTVSKVPVDGNISCHSLRKTTGYHMWKAGIMPALIMDIYNHSSYEVTKRYLGIAQDERDSAYLRLKLF